MITTSPTDLLPDPFAAMRKPALPAYDWTAGKNLNLVTTLDDVRDVRDWMDLVIDKSKRKPALISLDIETYGPPELWAEAVRLGAQVRAIKARRDALPHKKRRSPIEQATWDTLNAEQLAIEALADEMSARSRRSGLIAGLNKVRLVQLYAGGQNVWTLDILKLGAVTDVRALLKDLIYRSNIQWVGHNIQFDVAMLYAMTCGANAPADGYLPAHVPHCSMLQAQALLSLSYIRKNLETRVGIVLNRPLDKSQQVSDWGRPDLSEAQLVYASIDVIASWDLWHAQHTMVMERTSAVEGLENCGGVYEIMRNAIRGTAQIVAAGVEFDLVEHTKVAGTVQHEYDRLRLEIEHELQRLYADTASPQIDNVNSTVQWNKLILAWLTEIQKKEWPKTEKGALAVGGGDIKIALGRDIVPLALTALLTTFQKYLDVKTQHDRLGLKYQRWAVEIRPGRYRLFPGYMIGGAETGRYSASDPPLQQIPREDEYRKLFVARPGYKLVVCDYGQIEVRVAAVLSGDGVLLAAIEAGLDIHAITALACFHDHPAVQTLLSTVGYTGTNWFEIVHLDEVRAFFKGRGKNLRQMAKNSIFGLIYGQGPTNLMLKIFLDVGIWVTVQEAGRIQEMLLGAYPGLRKWINRTRSIAEDTHLAWTPQGRCYDVDTNWYTKSINTPCQGGAAEIMLEAMSAFPDAFGDHAIDGYLVMTVHDELIAEVKAAHAQRALDLMQETMVIAAINLFPSMPVHKLVEGGIGDNWKTAKEGK
jgi:DNA polymerase-1